MATTSSSKAASSALPKRPRPCWNTDRKSTRLNSSHLGISYAVFCLKKKKRVELSIPKHTPMPTAAHNRASEHHDNAAKAHRMAALFFLNDRATTGIYPLSLPDALPI